MVTEEEISEAVKSLLRESNPRSGRSFTTLNQVVQELQAKLGGHDLSHKLDFIAAQINNILFASQQPPQLPHRQLLHPQQPPPPQQQQPPPHPKDHFALHQNPNLHTVPVTSAFQTFPSNSSSAADAAVTEAPPPPPVSGNEVPKERLGFKKVLIFYFCFFLFWNGCMQEWEVRKSKVNGRGTGLIN